MGSEDVMLVLDRQFADYGILETLISDNGLQFANAEFQVYARKQSFQHTTSSPH
jgi:hypothetical protein